MYSRERLRERSQSILCCNHLSPYQENIIFLLTESFSVTIRVLVMISSDLVRDPLNSHPPQGQKLKVQRANSPRCLANLCDVVLKNNYRFPLTYRRETTSSRNERVLLTSQCVDEKVVSLRQISQFNESPQQHHHSLSPTPFFVIHHRKRTQSCPTTTTNHNQHPTHHEDRLCLPPPCRHLWHPSLHGCPPPPRRWWCRRCFFPNILLRTIREAIRSRRRPNHDRRHP